MIRLVTLFSLALATLLFQPAAHATATTDQKAVLVTGASSGLGRVMAETKLGVRVKGQSRDSVPLL